MFVVAGYSAVYAENEGFCLQWLGYSMVYSKSGWRGWVQQIGEQEGYSGYCVVYTEWAQSGARGRRGLMEGRFPDIAWCMRKVK